VALGNGNMMENESVDLGALVQRAEELRGDGQTVMFVAIDGQSAGLVGVADPIKDSTDEAVRLLHEEGIEIIMLTGDSRTTAEAVARKLGIDRVEAEVLPDQKNEVIRKLQDEGRMVAMAGDGINDAPALAQAHVGIAMGTGTDVAMQSAGVTSDQRRLARHRQGPPPQSRHDAQHPPEPVLRVRLQRDGHSDRGRLAVSRLWLAAESHDRGGGDEFE
jgi:P-type Cu+ transporter